MALRSDRVLNLLACPTRANLARLLCAQIVHTPQLALWSGILA